MPCAKEGCRMQNGTNQFCIHHRPDVEFPECSICLKPVRRTKEVLECNHIFHKRCIDYWYMRSPTCPMCRAPIVDAEVANWQEAFGQVLHDELARAVTDMNNGARTIDIHISINQ